MYAVRVFTAEGIHRDEAVLSGDSVTDANRAGLGLNINPGPLPITL